MIETVLPLLSLQEIIKLTSEDSICSPVLKWALREWPRRLIKNQYQTFEPFFPRRHGITTQHGCLTWDIHTIIPMKVRNIILQALYHNHTGMVRINQSLEATLGCLALMLIL